MRVLLLPSLTTPGHFLVTQDIGLEDALSYIESFQARVIHRGVTDRQAPAYCNMQNAEPGELVHGDQVQALLDFPIEAFQPLDLQMADETELTDLGRVSHPGLSGLRAVYCQTDSSATDGRGGRASLVLGTVVVFNERRYTREYRDNELAAHVEAIKADENAHQPGWNATPVNLQRQAQVLSRISRQLLDQAQALHAPSLAQMSVEIREVVSAITGNVVDNASTTKPGPTAPSPEQELDQVVQQVVDQGREVVRQVGKGIQSARSWLADQIDRRG